MDNSFDNKNNLNIKFTHLKLKMHDVCEVFDPKCVLIEFAISNQS